MRPVHRQSVSGVAVLVRVCEQSRGRAHRASFILVYQSLVDQEGTGSGGQAEDERALRGGAEGVDAVDNVSGGIAASSNSIVADDQAHGVGRRKKLSVSEGKKPVAVNNIAQGLRPT